MRFWFVVKIVENQKNIPQMSTGKQQIVVSVNNNISNRDFTPLVAILESRGYNKATEF